MANDVQKVESDIRVALEAGAATKPVHPIDGVPESSVVVVKDGYSIKSLAEVEKYRDRPRRIWGTVTMHTPQSFIDYVERFHDEHTVIAADLLKTTLSAVLNYHEAPAAARWADHRVTYACRQTKEWQTWNAAHNKRMPQDVFAQFIEENLPDIARPDGATILELAENLQAKKEVTFSGKVNRTNQGRQLQYDETIEASSRRGEMKIPDQFVLGLRPFEGADPYELRAFLRYDVNGGKLQMWVSLDRPHKVVETAFEKIVVSVESAFGTLLLIHGDVA